MGMLFVMSVLSHLVCYLSNDRGVDVSGRTILRWVQKFGPALSEEIRRCRKPVSTTWLVDETYVKILGKWHYLYRGVDEDGQVLDCWLVTDA